MDMGLHRNANKTLLPTSRTGVPFTRRPIKQFLRSCFAHSAAELRHYAT